jgi:hypothetical protein
MKGGPNVKRTIAGMAAGVLGGLLLGTPAYSFGHEQGDERHEHGGMGQKMSKTDMRAHSKECEGMMRQMGSMMRGDMGSMDMMGADA